MTLQYCEQAMGPMCHGISEESFHRKDFQGTLLETKYKRLWEELSRILET